MQLPQTCLLSSLCRESAAGLKLATFRRNFILTGQNYANDSLPSMSLASVGGNYMIGFFSTSIRVKYKENKYNGPDVDRVQAHWDRTRKWFLQNATAPFPSWLELLPHFQKLDYLDAAAWGWIAQQEHTIAQVWHTKQGVFRRKVPGMCGTIL